MDSVVNNSIKVDSLEELAGQIRSLVAGRSVFVLTDSNIQEKWIDNLIALDPGWGDAEILEVEPGEDSKSIEVCSHLWSHLLDCNADRKALLINIGGGMITDLGGFVASTYKRGISFVHIPTSLLGMVDAANGGKTGVNHFHTKNSIGTFQLPEQVLLFAGFLETLEHRELKSGFAEMLKHGLIKDAQHWNDLSLLPEITPKNISPLILQSVGIKEAVVKNDFYESGERKLLNVGHTVGHAIESYFMEKGNNIAHGEAVALGILCETHIALQLGILKEGDYKEITDVLKKFFPLSDYSIPPFEEVSHYLLNDKKNAAGKLLFSLPTAIGHATYNFEVTIPQILSSYNAVFAK